MGAVPKEVSADSGYYSANAVEAIRPRDSHPDSSPPRKMIPPWQGVRCASCLPLSLRSRPGRGRSLMAASSPSSTNRLRALATVRALTETASAASRSDSPSSAFSNARARFSRAGQRLAPAGYLNQIGPLGWCQFDFVLYGRHIRVRPPWKIIPKPTQSHILYQHFMEPVLVKCVRD